MLPTRHHLLFISCLLLAFSMSAQTVFRGVVTDAQTNAPIPDAKIGVIKQGIGVLSQDNGRFVYKKYHQVIDDNSQLIVRAPGYETIRLDADALRALLYTNSRFQLTQANNSATRPGNKIKVFWDISEGMQKRDPDKELEYLAEFLGSIPEAQVQLEIFSDKVHSVTPWTVWDGVGVRFRESVNSQTYNGPSNYSVLQAGDADQVILFSNGEPDYGLLNMPMDVVVHTATSQKSAEGVAFLANAAAYTSGSFAPLFGTSVDQTIPATTAVAVQENNNTEEAIQSKTKPPMISGVVKSLGKPLQGASVYIKGTLQEYATASDGSFQIPAKDGDILAITYLGMYPKEALVKEGEDIAVELIPKNDVLKEVVLTSKYKTFVVGSKEMKGTTVPFAPGGVTSMGDFFVTSDDITPNGRTLEMVIRDLFAQVVISHRSGGPVLVYKGDPIGTFVVNGIELGPGEPPPYYIPDTDIESIVLKDSGFMTTRYGPLLSGRAIIVTTKSAPLSRAKRVNSALVKDNDYTENIAGISDGVVKNSSKISGVISSPSGTIQGASVTVKGTLNEVYSNAEGQFEIEAQQGEVLQVRYLGMYGKDVLVKDSSNISINLMPSSDLLNEVTLEGKTKNKDIINGTGPDTEKGMFYLDGRRFDVTTLTRDDYKFEHLDAGLGILQGLNGKLSNVVYKNGTLYIRGVEPVYFIDGRPTVAVEVESLSGMLIETISIKKNRVGGVGIAGAQGPAVFIQTKLYKQNNTKIPSPLVKGNDYTEEVATYSKTNPAVLKVAGKVFSAAGPIQGASLIRNGSFDEYTSKADGSFTFDAAPGDLIIVRYLGMYSKSFEIEAGKSNYEIELIAKNDVLNEVVLTGDAAKDEMVQTAYGKEKKDKIGYDIKVLTKEEIPQGRPDLGTVLNGRFAGITASEDPIKGLTVNNSRAGDMLIVIDGNLFPPDLNRPWISPDRVERISVVKSIVGTTRYGTLGKNGVVEIVTSDYGNTSTAPPKSMLATANEYTEEVATIDAPATSNKAITGKVLNAKGPLNDATVTLKGSFNEVYTNASGLFSIKAPLEEVLVISKAGYYPKEVLIESRQIPDVVLTSKNQQLDEIVVAGSTRVDNTVETAYGEVSEDKIGTSTKTISKSRFGQGATNLRQLITGKVSGVEVAGGLYSGSEVVYKIRGGTQSINTDIPPIWIVNGIPYQDPPEFLDVQQIESISVLKSTSATSRYGSLAAGGAFLVKTSEMNFTEKAKTQQKSALVTGNDYVADSAAMDASLPAYIIRFRESGTPQEQFKLYQKLSRTQESPLEFYVDAAAYFSELDPALGDEVRADLAYISRNNTKALRTLAYVYDTRGDTKNMVMVNERIVQIAPQEAQSYRDLALAYQQDGQYDKALELYINMLGERIKGVNFDGIEKPLRSELYHLATLHKDKIDFERLPNEWLRADFNIDIRMVVEWSDRSVPFEFQFVNPEKKFFKWTHTLEENRERLQEEQRQGYQMEEFIIDDAPPGEWLINIQYLGDESDYVLPPFLKYTVFKNYGTPQETREIKVVKLFKQLDKVTLGKVML